MATQAKKGNRAKATPRVVRSLHLSRELDAKIVRAARLTKTPIAAFVREAAEASADLVIGRAA